jgi:nucleoside-diphosphate-sugar epimerase
MTAAKDKILVIGANGQLGSELTGALRERFGEANVIATDISPANAQLEGRGPFEKLDIMDRARLGELAQQHQITQIYHLAAVLSATGEQKPKLAWDLNMDGLLNVLELAVERKLHKVYWPSSIAVFGPTTPRHHTPQHTIMEPNTVYGFSKQAGERWCEWFFQKRGVDVRSLRYPGLIGYKALPGGGTTDYAVDIYHQALATGAFECFLSENTYLPMMYMPDALKATIDLMEAPATSVKIRSSYNLSAMSFSPKEVAESIREHIPDFKITYKPDQRQQIADSWPASIDDTAAREDWNWIPDFDLKAMTADMLENLRKLK